jgi:hypothetical protein
MQIALPGSLHRVIMWLCTHSQLSTTVEAHDADRPAGLAASCHHVAVQCALTHSYPPQSRHTMQIALPGSLHRVIVSLCSSVHSLTAIQHSRGTRCRSPCRARCIVSSCGCALTHSYPPQSRRTMQIALPGSLHRVIVSLCTHSQLSTEAHDADRPAGLAASCHRVAVHSLTAIHHSRGTRCRSPCRAHCIVSLWALFQLSTTCVQSAPVCESPASGAVT